MPDRHRVLDDLVKDPVLANSQPPQVRRSIREGLGRAGIVGKPVDGV
jgi:hypothetical protein